MGDILNIISDDVLQMMETVVIVFVDQSFYCFAKMKISGSLRSGNLVDKVFDGSSCSTNTV